MESELIAIAKEFGPWAFIGLSVLMLLRKEIGTLLISGRSESRADSLMAQLVVQFSDNLEMFKTTGGHAASIARTNAEILEVQRQIYTEMVRGGK